MKKISRLAIVAAVVLLVAATPAAATPPDHDVPIKGTVMGEHTPPDFTKPGCPDWAAWRFSSEGVGQMSHLGRVEYSLTQCTVPGPDGFASAGTVEVTAANGDKLFIEHTMLSQLVGDFPNPDGFMLVGEWEAVGGTGRFTHATGSGWMDGVGDIPNGVAVFGIPDGLAQFNFWGDIAYIASDRSKR